MKSYLLVCISLVINLLQMIKSDDDCLYTFEDESEIEDFDPGCDGLKGKWKIMELPVGAPSSFGKKALTIDEESNGCLKSSKQLTLNSTTKVLTRFYWKKAQYGSVTFKILFLNKNLFCQNNINCQEDFVKESCIKSQGCVWDIGQKYDSVTEETWVENEFHVFTLPGIQDYEMQVNLYLNSATVMIDSITILDIISNSDQCYLNPRTTTATTESTTITTTTEIITITTTTEITTDPSTVAETTTSTADMSTTSTEVTTEELTSMTTMSDSKTTEASTLITETTTDAVVTTSEITSEKESTGTSDAASTISDEIPITTSSMESVTSTSESDGSSTASSPPSTESSTRFGDLSFSLIFFIVFAVVISIVIVVFFCSFVIWFQRRKRILKTNYGASLSMTMANDTQKTDHEYYNEVRKKWESVTRK